MQVNGIQDKVAIVVGAGARGDGIGNGRAAAILLAQAGARVVAIDRLEAPVHRTVEMIHEQGGAAIACVADVTREEECQRVVQAAIDTFGGVDILDNNVGIGSQGTVVDEDPQQWHRVMRINVDSVFLMSKHVIPVMRSRGAGTIVNVSSISALRPRGLTAYSASKGAVIALTRAMAVDHAADGVRVNCIAPGPDFTPMVSADGVSEERREQRRLAAPLQVEGTGWDIGNAVVFLDSDMARFITGQTFVVDGGVTLQAPAR